MLPRLFLNSMAFAALLTFASTVAAQSSGKREVLKNEPCPGCFAAYNAGAEPTPLILVLHGDDDTAWPVFLAWERFAAPRRVALLSPACPKNLGCPKSWWKWNGDPAWLLAQIEALATRRALDRERLYIVGWSGGASYIGGHSFALEETFAAIVIHGGGMPPSNRRCNEARTPVWFLVGDRNPLHSLAVGLRDYYADCEQEIVWKLVRGGEHPDEWKALDRHGGQIADWLLGKHRPPPKPKDDPAAPALSGSADATPAEPVPSSSGRPVLSNGPRAPAPTRPPSGCGCRISSLSASRPVLQLAALALALGLRSRRRTRINRQDAKIDTE